MDIKEYDCTICCDPIGDENYCQDIDGNYIHTICDDGDNED